MKGASLRALVVEDDAKVVEFVCHTMVVLGHDCICATNVQDAREALRNENFDYVLLDLKIPALPDGLFPSIDCGMTFLGEISRERGNGQTPIFVMTSYTDQGFDMAVKLTNMGASRCIPKPLADKLLSQIIQEVLADHSRKSLLDGQSGQPASRGRQPKSPKTLLIAAPPHECYAELDAQTADRGMLRVLFTKPKAERPTKAGEVPVCGQQFKVLLGGIEAAHGRRRAADEDSPSGRLPEDEKVVLQWSPDSLVSCGVKDTSGAKRGAMRNVRCLVWFQGKVGLKVGLITNQDKNAKLWMSTVPFRLRRTEKL